MKARIRKDNKNSALLVSVAESIGSTLGTIAAKATVAQKTLAGSRAAYNVMRGAKKLVRKSKSVVRKTRKSAPLNLRKSKRARGSLRRAT